MVNSLDKSIANGLTIFNLILGLLAIISITNHQFSWAAVFILLAALMDLLDGKVARYFNSSSEIGKNLDSLCDLISFGIAPALLIFAQINIDVFNIPVAIAFIVYVCCGAYRLARFNTLNINNYFVGLPITVAGILLSVISLINDFPLLSIIIMFILSFFMVSTIKVPKL